MVKKLTIASGSFAVCLLCVILCACVVVYVAFGKVPHEGLEYLFLLPCGFAISLFAFWKEYKYCINSFGLIILYTSSVIRYVITPLLIVMSQSVVSTIRAGADDYRYAVLVELFELFVVMSSIKLIWPKHLGKKKYLMESTERKLSASFRLSWAGFLFVVALIALVVLRGHLDNIVSHLSTWFVRVYNKDDLFSYDMMAFDIVKAILFLLIVSQMKRVYDKTSFKALPIAIAIAAGLANTMLYVYTERTDLAVLVIASLSVLSSAFPKSKKTFYTIFGIGGIAFVTLVFLEGSLQYKAGSAVSSVSLANYAKVAQLYTTGPSVIANAHMNYESVRSQINFLTYAKDLVGCCDLFSTVPFLRFIPNMFKGGRGTVELYITSIGGLSYIIPNSSLTALYVSNIFGWLLEILFIIWNIKLLGYFERIMLRFGSLLQIYAGISIVTMVGAGVFCNNFQLMLHSFSSLPLWLLILSYVNEFGNKVTLRGKPIHDGKV